MKTFALKYLYILATGSIFYLFSERYFWSFWRIKEDSVSATVWGVVFYSLAAYAVLFLIDRYKINSKEGLLIVGFLFGFLIEGMMAGMLYTALMPLVITVALPWHAFVTLFLGWQYLPRLFSQGGFGKKFSLALLLSSVWFFWAIGWFMLPTAAENSYSINNFIVHGLGTTIALVLVYIANTWLRSLFELTFKAYEGILIMGLLFLFLGLVHPATIPFSFPLSLVVIMTSVLLLRRQKYIVKSEASVYAFSGTISGLGWLFAVYGMTTAFMVVALALDIKIMTAYLFAGAFMIASVWYGFKSLKYFLN